jgi:hypothetical protein
MRRAGSLQQGLESVQFCVPHALTLESTFLKVGRGFPKINSKLSSYSLDTNILMDSRWLFRLMLCMDANFRLNNRLRSSDEKDPGLGAGFSYFVEPEPYSDWVLKHANQEEVCSVVYFPYSFSFLLTCIR